MGEVDDLLAIAFHVDFHFEVVEFVVDSRLAVEILSAGVLCLMPCGSYLFRSPIIYIFPVFGKPPNHLHLCSVAPIIIVDILKFLWEASLLQPPLCPGKKVVINV